MTTPAKPPLTPSADPIQSALDAWRAGAREQALETLRGALGAGEPLAAGLLLDLASTPDAPPGACAAAMVALGASDAREAGRIHAAALAEGLSGAPDPAGAIAARIAAAEAGDPGALTEIALLHRLADAKEAALSLFVAAAKAGSGHAIAALLREGAETGAAVRTAEALAPALSRAGHPLANALFQACSGVQVDADPPAPDFAALLAPEALTEAVVRPVEAETLSEAGAVRRHRSAFPPVWCDYLAAGAAALLKPASVFDPSTGGTRASSYRTGLTATVAPSATDLAVWAFRARMAALAWSTPAQGEPLSVLAYRPGDAYKAHFDFISEDGGQASADLAARGQRKRTALVLLNTEFEGGATTFPRLDVSWRGARGEALTFRNVGEDGAGDPRTLHAGEPVRSGMKLLASLWLRERARTYA